MPCSKLRQQIAWVAARLMHTREVTEYYQAKQKAARACVRGWVKPSDLPSNAEIRHQVQVLARLHDAGAPDDELRSMRLRALWWMNRLSEFHPKLIGSVLTGGIREGSDIDVHLFTNHVEGILWRLEALGAAHDVEYKRVSKDNQVRVFTHVHVHDQYPVELTVYPVSKLGHRFRSSITGKPIERVGSAELEKLIKLEYEMNDGQVAASIGEMNTRPDRWNVYLSLLVPLENVIQSSKYHPEGDALYHSLQVFELARDEAAYDEDFLLAALLHDVGKAIDPSDHVAAGLEALDGFISERTAWLIAHHMETHKIQDHTIGARRRRHLASHPYFEDLLCLGDCDRAGRVPGISTCQVEEALDYIEELGQMFA